jgi:hypothetical protein
MLNLQPSFYVKSEIRDEKISGSGSRIRDKHPGSETLFRSKVWKPQVWDVAANTSNPSCLACWHYVYCTMDPLNRASTCSCIRS